MVKRSLLFTILILPVFAYAAEDWQKFPIGPFGTLNNRDSSYAISATQAQDLLNVDLTPSGKSVRKRKGYGIAWTLTNTTSAVHGVYDFYNSTGNENTLFFNDRYISVSANRTAPSVLVSTAPNGATWQCTDSLGFAYCVNTNRSALYKITDTGVTTISAVASTGTMVATAVTRLAMAGFSEAPSRIDFSADTDFTTWGSGSLGTSPAQFTINAPGAKITHITYAFGRLMWFKDTSFGYILIGNQPFQSDWVIKTVSYDVGTNDNTSVYREGILYFRGKDGHIYAFDGYSYQRMTKEISGTINNEQINAANNSWTQSTASDFGAGSSTTTPQVDTTTFSGQIQLPFNTTRFISPKSYFVADISTHQVFQTPGLSYQSFVSTADFFLSNIKIILVKEASMVTNPTLILYSASSQPNGTPVGILASSTFTSTIATSLPGTQISVSFSSSVLIQNGYRYWIAISNGDPSYNVSGHKLYWVTTSTTDFSSNLWACGGNERGECPNLTSMGFIYTFEVSGATYTTTATWQSSIKATPALTAWDSFNVTSANSGNSFFIRSSTGIFTINSATPSWTALSNGDIPSVPTGANFQIRDVMVSYSSGTPILYDFTQNWFEGTAADKAYAIYFDDRLWWSETIGAGNTINNRILIYDLLNQGWLLYDLPSNGFYIQNNSLYFGSSNGGYIYKYGEKDNDNGSAINSYWKSKDYFGGDPFTTQELANISLSAKEVSNSTVTVTYTTNGSSSTAFYFPTTSSKAFVGLNKNLPAGTIGSNFNVMVGNNSADQPWEIFGMQVGIRPRSWVPGGP